MSRKANPYDNALAESFAKTLKDEEVLGFNYDTIDDMRRTRTGIARRLTTLANDRRARTRRPAIEDTPAPLDA